MPAATELVKSGCEVTTMDAKLLGSDRMVVAIHPTAQCRKRGFKKRIKALEGKVIFVFLIISHSVIMSKHFVLMLLLWVSMSGFGQVDTITIGFGEYQGVAVTASNSYQYSPETTLKQDGYLPNLNAASRFWDSLPWVTTWKTLQS